MERSVHPVLREVRHQDDEQDLDEERERSDDGREPFDASPAEQDQRRLQRQDRQHLDQQRVDEEVGEVDDPLAAEHRLLGAQGEQPFERNEHRRVEQEIEDEEIDDSQALRPSAGDAAACDPPSSAAASVNADARSTPASCWRGARR